MENNAIKYETNRIFGTKHFVKDNLYIFKL